MCYICSYERAKFDKESEGGFERHIREDHNLWNYVYYVVHLEKKDTTEMTGTESYVHKNYLDGEISWIPRNAALCLEKKNEDDESSELQNMQKNMERFGERFDTLNEKLAKLEAARS